MGLLGVIVEVTLQLRKVPSPFVEATTTPVRDLAESLDVMEQAREHADFAIAWVDAFASGKGLGRGTVETARWIETGRCVDKKHLEDSLSMPEWIFGLLPATPTWSVARPFFRPAMVRFANTAKYTWDQWKSQRCAEMLFTDFNFMLNKIPGWKHLYRPYGYMEFQPMLPRRNGVKTLAEILQMCQAEGMESLLCGVKPHTPDDYMLSYEGDGYSIGIDIALRGRNGRSVEQFARNLYGYVADQGGKAFLAKDEVLPRDLFERMYPRHRDFLQVKRRIDPQNLFASDMYRRLLA
jgi:FAD/FMN-containing dehydrogenase